MEEKNERSYLQMAANIYDIMKNHYNLQENEITAVLQILVYHDSMFNSLTTIK